MAANVKRVRLFVDGLDERMSGGIPAGSVVLITGKPGSMKSMFTFHILFENARSGAGRSLYLSVEQGADELRLQAAGLGMDLHGLENVMVVDDLAVDRTLLKMADDSRTWFDLILHRIETVNTQSPLTLIALDSLNVLKLLTGLKEPRLQLFSFFRHLKKLGITTYIVSEIDERGPLASGEDYMVDGIIHVDMVREGKTVGLLIGVPKMRLTNHSRNYFPLIADASGWRVVVK